MTPSGNKNEALPLLAAAVLSSGTVVIENVPKIRDVSTLIEILRGLGVQVDWSGDHTLAIDPSRLHGSRPDAALAAEIRASFLLAAPLLARTGLAVLPRPGGDKIICLRSSSSAPGSRSTTRTIAWSSRGPFGAPRCSWTRRASPERRPR